jgi:hypothetical protein
LQRKQTGAENNIIQTKSTAQINFDNCYVSLTIRVKLNQKQSRNRPQIIVELTQVERNNCLDQKLSKIMFESTFFRENKPEPN